MSRGVLVVPLRRGFDSRVELAGGRGAARARARPGSRVWALAPRAGGGGGAGRGRGCRVRTFLTPASRPEGQWTSFRRPLLRLPEPRPWDNRGDNCGWWGRTDIPTPVMWVLEDPRPKEDVVSLPRPLPCLPGGRREAAVVTPVDWSLAPSLRRVDSESGHGRIHTRGAAMAQSE